MRKIPTLFVRDFEHDHGRYVTEQIAPGCEWVLQGLGFATRKLDGACVRLDENDRWWARRELKSGQAVPAGFESVEHDPVTDKAVGWVPMATDGRAVQLAEALAAADGTLAPGTYELCGPKVNGNPEGYRTHWLAPHGERVVSCPYRDYRSLRTFLLEGHPDWEGLVFWRQLGHPEAGLAKIKARDFR